MGALCAGESGGSGENGARGLSGMGEMPGHTIGELIGNGEHLVGGAKPPNGFPVRMKASCAPTIFPGPSSSLSSSSIAMGIFGIFDTLLLYTGGFALDGTGEEGTRRSKRGLPPGAVSL